MIYGICVICSFAQSESYFKFILIFFIVIAYCYTQLRQKINNNFAENKNFIMGTFTFNNVLFILNYSVFFNFFNFIFIFIFISDPHSCMD